MKSSWAAAWLLSVLTQARRDHSVEQGKGYGDDRPLESYTTITVYNPHHHSKTALPTVADGSIVPWSALPASTAPPRGSTSLSSGTSISTPLFISKTLSRTDGFNSVAGFHFSTPSLTPITTNVIATTTIDATLSADISAYTQTAFAPQQSTLASPADCYTLPGGLLPTGNLTLGCNATLAHVLACVGDPNTWQDPYDITQSRDFQACMCETSATEPFTVDSTLYKNFTSCAQCLMLSVPAEALSLLVNGFNTIDSFCRTQNPLASLFLFNLDSWFDRVNYDVAVTSVTPLPGVPEILSTLDPLFSTTPPLANIAYGASALSGGQYADATPVLTTMTSTDAAGTQTITSVASWVHTGCSTCDNSKATISAATEASSSSMSGAAGNSTAIPSLCFAESEDMSCEDGPVRVGGANGRKFQHYRRLVIVAIGFMLMFFTWSV
jgi:hypothetical protein